MCVCHMQKEIWNEFCISNIKIVHGQIKNRNLLFGILVEVESKYFCIVAQKPLQITAKTMVYKMANNFGKSAQDGNNGTMNSKVSNPC